ncbi:TraR/DksA C4-type zinc finger protein [Ectopseudomonas hydrolytica]
MDERYLEMAEAVQAERLQHAIDNRVVYQGESATECESCGGEIPEARRRAVPGCQMCVHCQGYMEGRR